MSGSFAAPAAGGGFTQSLGINGWSKQPNGLILQWAKFSVTGNSTLLMTTSALAFPISFNTVYTCTCSSNLSSPIVSINTLADSSVTLTLYRPDAGIMTGTIICYVFATGI